MDISIPVQNANYHQGKLMKDRNKTWFTFTKRVRTIFVELFHPINPWIGIDSSNDIARKLNSVWEDDTTYLDQLVKLLVSQDKKLADFDRNDIKSAARDSLIHLHRESRTALRPRNFNEQTQAQGQIRETRHISSEVTQSPLMLSSMKWPEPEQSSTLHQGMTAADPIQCSVMDTVSALSDASPTNVALLGGQHSKTIQSITTVPEITEEEPLASEPVQSDIQPQENPVQQKVERNTAHVDGVQDVPDQSEIGVDETESTEDNDDDILLLHPPTAPEQYPQNNEIQPSEDEETNLSDVGSEQPARPFRGTMWKGTESAMQVAQLCCDNIEQDNKRLGQTIRDMKRKIEKLESDLEYGKAQKNVWQETVARLADIERGKRLKGA